MQVGATVLGSQQYARASRPSTARVAPVAGPSAAEGVVLREEAPNTRQMASEPTSRRSQPAELLHAMIDQMGGASTSVWKGMYVNLVV